MSTIAGNGVHTSSGNGGPATAASLRYPGSLAVDAAGNVYEIDFGFVRKINTAGIIDAFAGSGDTTFGDGGQATAATVYDAEGLAVDAAGNVYIAGGINDDVRKVNTAGIISTIAGINFISDTSSGYSGDDGPATAARLHGPVSIAVDGSSNLYIADVKNAVVRKVDSSGIITTFAGDHVSGFSGDGGPATAAQISNNARSLAVTNDGILYIEDINNYVIRRVGPVPSAVNMLTAAPPTTLNVYSNPNSGAFSIMLSAANNEQAHVVITNIAGQQVWAKDIIANKVIPININEPAGEYLLQATTTNICLSKKVSIVR